jgi:hypothetical protein
MQKQSKEQKEYVYNMIDDDAGNGNDKAIDRKKGKRNHAQKTKSKKNAKTHSNGANNQKTKTYQKRKGNQKSKAKTKQKAKTQEKKQAGMR